MYLFTVNISYAMLKVKFIKEEYGHKNKYELISYIRHCRELLGMYQSTLKKLQSALYWNL